jgi:DNA invertase Pin-like site-specific DNA recombinase
MIFHVLAAFAQFERDLAGERTADGLAHKRAQGERCSRWAPYGFTLDPSGSKLVPVGTEQTAMRLIRRLAEGRSLRQLSAELTRRGVLARCRRPFSVKTLRSVVSMRPDGNSKHPAAE